MNYTIKEIIMLHVQPAKIHFDHTNTPISDAFDDVYFSNQNGLAETQYVFLEGNHLWERWQRFSESHFVIAETGFGTGLNFFATTTLFRKFRQENPNSPLKRLFFISFEKHPIPLENLIQAHQSYPEFQSLSATLQLNWQDPISGCTRIHFEETTLDLWFGDIQTQLPQLGDYMQNRVDAWFLDGFAPSKNPDMWNEQVYALMHHYSKTNGTFATFTAASAVRKGLEAVGFTVEKRKGFGHKRECLAGTKNNPSEQHSQTPWYFPQSAQFNGQADIAIVGGGIASLFTALSLLERGAKVTVYCEDEALALNASGNKQGAFYPQLSDDDLRNIRFYIHAFAYGHQRLRQAIVNNIEFEHEICGIALCGYDEKSEVKLAKIASYHWSSDLYRPMTSEELSDAIGLPVPCGGGFIPKGAWLAPRQFVQNSFAYLHTLGLNIKTSQKITALEQNPVGWQLITANNEKFSHDIVVLANGYKVNHFTQTEQLPLYPVRGQVSQIQTTETLRKLKSVVCYDGYLTPVDYAQTSHCIGASHVRDSDDRQFSEIEQQENQQKIQKNLRLDWTQDVNTQSNLARVGIRCAVRDRIPMVGNVPNFYAQAEQYKNLFNLRRRKQPIPSAVNYNNLYLIAALGSRGLTSAPILGETLASIIYGEPVPLSEDIMHALSANRSWMRKLLKGATVV